MSEDHYNLENYNWLQTQCLKQGQSLIKQKVISIIKHNNEYMGKIQTTGAYFNLFGRFIYYNVGDHSIIFFAKLTT